MPWTVYGTYSNGKMFNDKLNNERDAHEYAEYKEKAKTLDASNPHKVKTVHLLNPKGKRVAIKKEVKSNQDLRNEKNAINRNKQKRREEYRERKESGYRRK